MAKLNGVKTVDMINGEITKVAYDGAEYVKVVDGSAKIGDLMFAKINNTDITKSAFYKLEDTGYFEQDQYTFYDDVEDDAYFEDGQAEVFRKVIANPSEPTPERLQVGDTVKVSIPEGQHPAYGWGHVKNGDVGKVNAVFTNRVTVEFPSHKSWTAQLTELVKVAEDGYVRVTDRKPKAGDYVKFSELPEDYEDCISLGKYYEITELDEWNDPQIIGDEGDIIDTEGEYFEVYEKAGAEAETLKEVKLKVEDYAKVINYGTHRSMKDGAIVKITETDRSSGFTTGAKRVSDDYYEVYTPKQLVKATDAEVAKALAPKFNVGDYAKLKTTKDPLDGFYAGQIVKLYDNTVGASDFKVRGLGVSPAGFTDATNLEKVSAEEVAKIEAEAKLAEQFAKLGRNRNEFKKGDVVRAIKRSCGGHPVGTIGELVYDEGLGKLRLKAGNNVYSHIPDVELIAPVESRVDAR